MKRLWFSLCLSRSGQRNEVCEFQESSEILELFFKICLLSLVVLCAAIFKRDCRYIIRSPLKQLTRSHYLLVIPSLQASSCSKTFNCATNAIHAPLLWEVAEKCHSAHTSKSSWWHKFMKFLQFCIGMLLHQKSSSFFEDLKATFFSNNQSTFFGADIQQSYHAADSQRWWQNSDGTASQSQFSRQQRDG